MIVVGINTRIYVKGTTTDPKLYIGNTGSSSVSVDVTVTDKNGTAVVSLTNNSVPAGGSITINLGDSLSTSTLNSEPYIVTVKDTNLGDVYGYHIIFVVNASISTPSKDGVEPYNVISWHKDTGLSLDLGKTPVIPYDDAYYTLIYYYKEDTKQGAYGLKDGLNDTVFTDWAKRLLIEYTIGFNSINEIVNYLLTHTYIRSQDVMNTIVNLISKGLYNEVAKILFMFYTEPLTSVMRVLKVEPDFDNLQMKITAIHIVGFGWNDIKDKLDGVITGASIGAIAGFIGTAGCAALTGGACLAVIGGLALAGGVLGYEFLSSDNSMGWSPAIHDSAEAGKKKIRDFYENDYTSTVNNLYQQGHIDETAKQTLLELGAKFRDISIEAINDLEETCYKQIKPCNKLMYAGLGVVGGLLADRLLGRVK